MRARPGESAWSLVIFTVLVQASAGVAVAAALSGERFLTLVAIVCLGAGAIAASFHLGRMRNVRHALSNLGSSWLSREGLLVLVFGVALAVSAASPDSRPAGILAALLGVALVGVIAMVYLIRTVPPWNTWMTPAAFALTAIGLGAAFSSKTVGEIWNGLGLMHLAAIAAAAQVLLGLLHARRFGSGNPRWFAAFVGALAIVGLLAAPARWLQMGTALLLFAEILNRQAFYESHRRVGL